LIHFSEGNGFAVLVECRDLGCGRADLKGFIAAE